MNKNKLFFVISLFICAISLNHIFLRAELDQANSGFSDQTFVGLLQKDNEEECWVDGESDQQCSGIMGCGFEIGMIRFAKPNDSQPYLSYAITPRLTNSSVVAFYRELTTRVWFLIDFILMFFLLLCVGVSMLFHSKIATITLMCLTYFITLAIIIFTFIAHDDTPFGVWQNVSTGFFALIFYSFFAIDTIKSNCSYDVYNAHLYHVDE